MSSEPRRRLQHLVSKGYQRNFAAENTWVSIIDCQTGTVVEERRSIGNNWRAPDFLSVSRPEEDVDDSLEKEFSRHERVILNRVRDIQAFTKPSTEQKRGLDLLAAIHLVRSIAFRENTPR